MTCIAMNHHPDNDDLVDRLFDYLTELKPGLLADERELAAMKLAVRSEFGAAHCYIRQRDTGRRLVCQVLSLFNGRNATEVARTLGISRATVYRMLKQPGMTDPESVSSVPRNETVPPIA